MKKLLVVILIGFIFNSCTNNDDDNKPKFDFQAQVNNVTNTPLAGVEIMVFKEGLEDPVKTIVSDNMGLIVASLENGNYRIEALKNGYTRFIKEISVNKEAEALKITLTGEVTLSGRIINSQSGKGLSGAKVSFSRDNSAGRLKESVTGGELILYTNDVGYFEVVGAPSGGFIQRVEKDGFFTRSVGNISLHNGINELKQAIAVEIPAPGAIRIVLTWGALPVDLDSHLTGPNGEGGRFYMYFDDKNPIPSVSLDVDDITSYGPETTTITQFFPGTYKYSVHDYFQGLDNEDGAAGMASSPTVVEVYDSNSLLSAFEAPPFSGKASTWRVFELVVDNTGAVVLDSKNFYFLLDGSVDF